MIYMSMLTGLMGLPFAENFADLFDLLMTKIKEAGGYTFPKSDVRQAIREHANQILGGSEVLMHGISRHAMSLVDISQSVSMGKAMPGASPLFKGLQGSVDPMRASMQFVEELTGVAGGQGMNFLRATMEHSDESINWLRYVMPEAINQQKQVYESYKNKQYQTRDGHPLVNIDLTDSWAQAELVGKALGFTPARESRARDVRWADAELKRYYLTRQDLVLNSSVRAFLSGDPREKAAAMKALADYNKNVPVEFKWSSDGLSAAIRSRIEGRVKEAAGLPTQDHYINLHKRYADSFK